MLSVIVPVYNAEKYLSRCLNSLLNQGMSEYEIICVNDGSTDGSSEILRKFKAEHPSAIRVVEQENGGSFVARNTGMLTARGDVLAFCDADDYLMPNAYNYLLTQYWNDGIDVLHFGSTTLDKYVLENWREPDEIVARVVYAGDGHGFYKRAMPYFVWQNLYRKSFLQKYNLCFRPLLLCDDTAFCMDVFMANPTTLYVDANIYRYTIAEGQLTRKRNLNVMRKIVCSYLILLKALDEYSAKYPYMKDVLALYKEQQMIPCVSRILSARYSKREWKELVMKLKDIGVLPIRLLGKVSIVLNSVMYSYYLYVMVGVFYRFIFLPYILPQLKRN